MLQRFDLIIVDSVVFFSKKLRFSQTRHSLNLLTYILSFFLLRFSGVEAKQRMNLKRCNLIKEGRQSYPVALCNMKAVSLYLVFKELIVKRYSLAQRTHSRRKVSATPRLVQPNLGSQRVESRKESLKRYP